MENKEQTIAELSQSLERRKRWFDRLQHQYAVLDAEAEELRQKVEELSRERDSLLGDITKLKARVAELEAQIPQPPDIILP